MRLGVGGVWGGGGTWRVGMARRGSTDWEGLSRRGEVHGAEGLHGKELCGEEALDREGCHCGEVYK